MVLGSNRRHDDAIAAFRTAMEIEPKFRLPLLHLAFQFAAKGMYDEQLAYYRKRYVDNAELTKALEDGFEKAGHKGAYRAVADLLAESYGKPGKRVDAMNISINYLHAGDYDLAIDWLEKDFEVHNANLPFISSGILWDPLRSDPRFQELLRKMNLPVDEKD